MSYDALGTGSVDDPSGFSGTTQFDSTSTTPFSNNDSDSGSQNFTSGTSQPGGGTKIQGNVIKGGRIISDTTIGRGDFRRNDPSGYDKWMTETGRSLQNPYGNQSLFSRVFGADKINYNLDPTTAQNILDAGFQRFTDFTGQDELSQKRAFGSLFGSPEGEMTAQGEVRKQVTPMSTGEIAGRLASSVMGMGPLVSMLPGGNVSYAPMNATLSDGSRAYDPQLDPQVNKDLASSGIMGALTGGANLSGLGQTLKDKFLQAEDVIRSAFTPPEVAAQQNKALGPPPTFDPRGPDAMSQNMLEQKYPLAAEEIQTMNLSQAAPQRADALSKDTLAGLFNASKTGVASSFAGPEVDVAANIPIQDFFQQNPELLSELMKESSFVASRVMDPSKSADYTIETETGEIFKPSPGDLGFNISLGTYPGLITEEKASPGISMPELNDIFSGIGTKLKEAMGGPDFRSKYEQATRNGYSIR